MMTKIIKVRQIDLKTGKEIEIEEEIEIYQPTKEEILYQKINEAKAYLANTDYKMTVDYFATLTEAEQVQLTQLRAEAREFIRTNEGDK